MHNNFHEIILLMSQNITGGNCAKVEPNAGGLGGGFWFHHCSYHSPTRPFGKIRFNGWTKSTLIASEVQMKIRPSN